MKHCAIIGGGVVGLFSAYYLTKAGHKVTVLDASDMMDGCSYGNAGMIVPSHVIPLAQPGMISKGIRWMFNKQSPFYLRPRFSVSLLSWGSAFYKHATQIHVNRSKQPLSHLSLFSKSLYQDLAKEAIDFEYQEKGLLMLYQSEKVRDEELEAAEVAKELGLTVDVLNLSELRALEKNCVVNAIGSVHYKSDAHLNPNKLMQYLKAELKAAGVIFKTQFEVKDFILRKDVIVGCKNEVEEVMADHFIIAGGAWSSELAKKLGLNIKLMAGKGYSFNLEANANHPTIPSILCEGKVAVTPMNGNLRLGGTMEITHPNDRRINMSRVAGIVNTTNAFYPEMKLAMPAEKEVWYGYRPCTPTGLPIISNVRKYKNVTLATGHAMMGLSLAPATGKLVEEIISNKTPSISIEMFK